MYHHDATRETRILRDRFNALADRRDNAASRRPESGAARVMVQVFQETTLPTTTDTYYACHPCTAGGTEAEGATPTFDCDAQSTLYVDFIGKAPLAGDMAVATSVGGRWLAELGSGSGGSGNPCTATICATDCPGGGELLGATVAVTLPDGTPVGSPAQTFDDGHGHACANIVIKAPFGYGPGDYIVTVSASGYKTWTATTYLDCGTTLNVQLQPDTAAATTTFTVTGCCGATLAGATVTLSDGQTATTDSSGQCSFWIGAGATLTYTVSKSRFVDASGSVAISQCQATTTAVRVPMTPASGYVCGPTTPSGVAIADPVPETLSLTDSVYGGCSLAWDPVNLWWTGSVAATFTANCNCPGASFTITYTLVSCGAGGSLYVFRLDWSSGDYGQCIFGSFFNVQVGCPTDTTTTCPGQPNNSYIYQPTAAATELRWIGGTNWSVTGPPLDATFDIAALSACPSATNYNPNLIYPTGGTITVTE